uniref:Uncharacterized protein n=1 Tax=Arcella intermedia TaxID=1963864 RepID=A0A6B2LDU6_9EUKA
MTLSLLLCFGWNLLFYLVASCRKFDKVTDLAYGTNFIVVVIVTLVLSQRYYIRQVVVTVLVSLWGLRLAGYLFYRILKIGEDKRFDEYRAYPLRFLRFWTLQMLTIWVVLLPEVILNSKETDVALRWNDFVGFVLFGVGFACESISDHQKFQYRQDPANKGHWCDVGLWRYSRHPNYFGELLLWFALYMICCSSFEGAEYATVVGPVYLTLIIMFLSGIPKLEKDLDERFGEDEGYKSYKRRTAVLIPFVPGIFTGIGKKLCCCEFDVYNSIQYQ